MKGIAPANIRVESGQVNETGRILYGCATVLFCWLIIALVYAGLFFLSERPVALAATAANVSTIWVAERSQEDAPPLSQLQRAIDQADHFAEGLYKPLTAENSTVSEYYGIPINVYYPGYRSFDLLGEDRDAFCKIGSLIGCIKTTSIQQIGSSFSTETFLIDYRTPHHDYSPLLRVRINWNFDANHYQITIIELRFDDTTTNAQIFLSALPLMTVGSNSIGQSASFLFEKSDTAHLQSNRYTIRHATQGGIDYYLSRGNIDRAERLIHFEQLWGFVPDLDIHAPIWKSDDALPDAMVFTNDQSGQSGVYHDCYVAIPQQRFAYVYGSKVCKGSPDAYIALSRFDPLAPTAQALQILDKYGAPNGNFITRAEGIMPPQAVARQMEAKFDALGFGIPLCTPIGCNSTTASAIRTLHFGALETILGYEYGNPRSQVYADRVAALVLKAQVQGPDGLISTSDGQEYYRPAQVGGVFLGWDREGHYKLDRSFLYRILDDLFNIPDEYPSLIVSNAETVHDTIAFLDLYRCGKYSVGCPETQILYPIPQPKAVGRP